LNPGPYCGVASWSWSLRFAEPIVLADRARLVTLRDAIADLGKALPKSDHDVPTCPRS
jgi:hypothetical protein